MKGYSLEHSGLKDSCTSEKSVPAWVTVLENHVPRMTKPAERVSPEPAATAACITLGGELFVLWESEA